ncbi:IPT/TIG domain-containing protein [Pontibacter fetidus]|uniref:T9SS type A sorting domain-containing protein n=1 Tax=Pontibacter fetidus TaxID=2700082 RepID=A0A6B2H738_9BACT|nr:IPT/TIG domain-containing protein [Pontibacter fetidus]NDK54904.1 T9SS type A sorting domain-containing protein [Pontibacter fetidus]
MARFYTHPFNSPLVRTLLITVLLMFVAGVSSYAQTVTSFTPLSGPVGTEITITGSGFTEAHTVVIGSGSTYDFTIVSDSEIKVKVPASASSGVVRVSSNQGSGTGSGTYSVVNAPAITSITPSSGPVGTEVTITGSNFSTVMAVSIGSGSTTNFTKISDSEIKVTVPSSASNGSIRLSSSQGSSNNSSSFTLVNAPIITSFSPSSGPIGTEVVITGTNFAGISQIYVGNGLVSTFTVESSTQLRLNVPSTASIGKIQIQSAQGYAYSSGIFNITGVPVITSFTPASGQVGTEITIIGQKFTGTSKVHVGGSATSFTVVSDTEIIATVPTTASTGTVQVQAPNGIAYSSTYFTVIGAPVVNSYSPALGPVGTEVTIKGSNFTGVSRLYLGSISILASAFSSLTDTEIKFNIPANASSGYITIFSSTGNVGVGQFTVTGTPTITSFNPSSGPVGAEVTILGTNLAEVSSIYVGGALVTSFNIVNSTEIKAIVPAAASTGAIKLSSSKGGSTSSNIFTVTGAPMVNSYSPALGPVGTEVTIKGSNFTGVSRLYLGSISILASAFSSLTDTEIKFNIPANASSGYITIFSSTGNVGVGQFTVTAPAIFLTASEINFADIPVGSTQVKEYQVSGLGLKNGESVTINLGVSSPYTISTNAGSGFGKSVTLNTVSNNKLNATSIFVKYTAAIAGENTDVILHQQGSTASKSLNIRGNAISPLPVELVAFTANLKNGQVNLNWTTASERDNSHFEIEKAGGSSSNFRKIDTVKSKVGTSFTTTNYSFSTYYNSNGATEYYRLKQVDLDGTPKYSKVVSVKPSGIVKQMEVAPNPITEDSKIYFTAEIEGKAIIRVTSVTGKQVYFEQIDVHGGENAVQLSKYNKLMPSVYIVTVEHDGKRESVRIEKK